MARCRGLRRHAYTLRRPAPLLRPVIVVGNLSVGGTGKTPLVCWLVAQLADRGLKPGVVTRGYGGSSRGARLVKPTDDPHVVGDESILLARRTNVPVADRARSARGVAAADQRRLRCHRERRWACSIMLWRATAKSSSSTLTAASATADCCPQGRCANRRHACAAPTPSC